MIKPSKINILLIEDEAYDIRRVQNTLKPFAQQLVIKEVVSDGQSALALLEASRDFDVVIMDFQISGGLRGEALIRRIKEIDRTLQIIVITKMTIHLTDFDFANRLIEAGAMWYCTKYPGDIEEYIYQPTDFILNILNAYEKKRLEKESLRTNRKLERGVQEVLERKQIIGESRAIEQLRSQIAQIAASPANVLIQGASGTGKELVATNIHYQSQRRFENFVPINCGSLPGHLVESELFGFEKGSFTGAIGKKKGLFEIANGGTIFLDEITELPLPVQSKLLRVIQEGEIDKIGRTDKVRVDVRVIAATNKDLYHEVKEKRFREDLYYRLHVISIDVPPLRERRGDIPLLVAHFLRHYCAEMNQEPPHIDDEAMETLLQHDWPGNVRELQNVVQRFLLLDSTRIDADLANESLGRRRHRSASDDGFFERLWRDGEILPWRDMELAIQEKYFRFIRERSSSDAEAARQLGLAPPNYHRMCKRLGLK